MASSPSFSASAQKRILVVDDEQRLAESLAALLRNLGYHVQAASSGALGLELIKRTNFDLVITDLRMEDVDGFDIMRTITENHPNTALIVITGHASTESAIEALHQRVADYITKPFDFDLLRGAIEKVFARQDTERLRRDLVSMLTHDIKVPLSGVVGFAQLIVRQDGSINPETPRCVELIVGNCNRILSMLDNYLTNTRLEEGRLEIVRLPVDFESSINEALAMLSGDIRRKHLRVEKQIEELMPPFAGDEPLLFRALSNLLSNAVKYSPEGAQIRVGVERRDAQVLLTVANTGSPLSFEEACQIFERYRRGSTSKGIEGSGLGLHVVRCIAEAHGGSARCTSEGGWTTFTIEVPFVGLEEEGGDGGHPPDPLNPGDSVRRG